MTSHARAGGPVLLSLGGGVYCGKGVRYEYWKNEKRAVIGDFIVPAEQSILARLETKIEWIEVFSLAHIIVWRTE